MPRLPKRLKAELSFYINPKTRKRQYNAIRLHCIHSYRQSIQATIVACPRYQSVAQNGGTKALQDE
jgi:hypothetical protein